jgi:Transposase
MLADQLDYVVGVDPHRDSHALAVVEVITGAVVFEARVAASRDGYAHALALVEQHAQGRRAFAIEGTGSFGAGMTRFLGGCGERVLEVGRLRRERRTGGKSDALDAIRAARSVLGSERPATPRAGGERQALQALVAAREGAVTAKRAGLCQLRDLLITTPEPLRSELRPLTRAQLLQRLAATRPATRRDPELRGSLLALRSIARRVLQLTAEERELAREIETLTRALAPQLLEQPRLLRPDDPLPPRSLRRPQTQPSAAHDPRHTETHAPGNDLLHRTPTRRGQDATRNKPLPQALPRPQPLPATRTRTADHDLTDIEASLAQPTPLSPDRQRLIRFLIGGAVGLRHSCPLRGC